MTTEHDRNQATARIEGCASAATHFDTFYDVLGNHQQRGFPEVQPPDVLRPADVFPEDIVADASAIAQTFIAHQAWASFTCGELARTNGELLQIANTLSFRQYAVYSAYRRTTSQWSSDEAKAELWSDDEYLRLLATQQRFTQKKLLLEADLARLKGNLAIISRLVTVRGQEVQLAAPVPPARPWKKK